MPNMSYCRFQNTSRDLQDCLTHFTQPLDSKDWNTELERNHRIRIVQMCIDIVEMCGGTIEWADGDFQIPVDNGEDEA